MKKLILFILLLISKNVDAADYTFVVFPDPHVCGATPASCDYTAWKAETKWVVDNRVSENIVATISGGDHCGDDSDDRAACFSNTWAGTGDNSDGYQGIDNAGVYWITANGNWDYDVSPFAGDRTATAFDSGVGTGRHTTQSNTYYSKMSAFSDSACNSTLAGLTGEETNGYMTFTAENDDWLILTFEFWPRNEAVQCAKKIIAAYPGNHVGIATHGYLHYDATLKLYNQAGGGDAYSLSHAGTPPANYDAQDLWDNFIKLYANIAFVISGHATGGNPDRNFNYKLTAGDNGNNVIQIYSAYHEIAGPPKGGGWFYYLRISDGAKSIRVTSYKSTAPVGADTTYWPEFYPVVPSVWGAGGVGFQ